MLNDTFATLIDSLETAIQSIDDFSNSEDGDDTFLKVRELLIKAQDLTHALQDE